MTLTNNGIINVNGAIRCTHDYAAPPGLINNSGVINISAGCDVAFVEEGYLINTGIVNNNGVITVQTKATIVNNRSAEINNNLSGEIRINEVDAYINNAGGKITNKGQFFNSNSAAVYNNNGGIFNNTDGTYTYSEEGYTPGSFFNGTCTCGSGTVIGAITVTGNMCPP